MRRLIVFVILLLFVTPAQAKKNKHKGSSSEPTVRERADTPLGFLPPPPPLPGMTRESQQERLPKSPARETADKPFGFFPPPPPLPGMSRDSQQDVIDRYYRNTERDHDQYRHYEDDDHGHYSHRKGKKKHLPPGLQKKAARGKELPPGWRKKIARGEVLDRDLRGHCQEVPRELSRQLPRPPRGTKFLRLEDKIIRVVESTFEIVDVFTYGR